MLQKLGDHIANCLARAADADRCAAEASSEDIRIDNERIAKTWRYVASSYQFAERLERFLLDSDKARSVRPPVAPAPPRKLVIVVDDDPSLLKAVGPF